MGVYPVQAMGDQKRTIRCLASGFFLSGGILYKRTIDVGLLRCIDAKQATTIMTEVHSGVHGDLIHSPSFELHTMSAPWPFVAWGMDVIGPIDLAASNGNRFILVAIDYFTKWVEAKTFKYVTKNEVSFDEIVGETPYLLVYGTEAVIPTKVEISSLRIVAEAEIDDDEWVKTRLEQLSLIEDKRLAAVCHG
ncbi:uncharacterized protein [Nicotiana sylvestris]|uniref:uncharacterized protein n=1 Tax=Nicotiana sylvestris TaxID=4096 RepID=UPI00388C4034